MPESVNAEEIRIKALLENWADAVRRHDLPTILAHHEQDMLMFDLPPPAAMQGDRGVRTDLGPVLPLSQARNGV
jgi:ketosteroid isomerase-like protein